jgi:hypothetical protein
MALRATVSFACYHLQPQEGCAMAQAVSRLPLTAEARVRALVVSYGIHGGKL